MDDRGSGPVGSHPVRPTDTSTVGLALVGCIAALIAAIYPLVAPRRDVLPASAPIEQAIYLLSLIAWVSVLVIGFRRRPPLGAWPLILAFVVLEAGGALRFADAAPIQVLGYVQQGFAFAVIVHVLLAYPGGHLAERRDRGLAVVTYGLAAAWALVAVADPGSPTWEPLILALAFGVIVPAVFVRLWRRWRDAGPARRRSLQPLVVTGPIAVAILAADRVGHAFSITPLVAFFGGPAGAALLAVGPLLIPGAILVGDARTRLDRRGLDRLVAEIAGGVPVGGLRDVLARSLGDPTLDLVFAAPSGGYVDPAGRPVTVPDRDPDRAVTVVVRGGIAIAAIVHDPQLDADEPGLVTRAGEVAGLALENEQLAADVRAQLAEVRASRARIAEAGDVERRRIERDLHDGAQARLVALGMRLQVARATMPEAAGVLDDATLELEAAIGEIRGLAAGVHPTILTEAGLAAAIDDLAERAPVPVEVDAPRSRFPAPVETVAYFVVAEALTNAVRHADAGLVRVRVATEVDTLEIRVADDGRGGASPTGGSGLRGLADRLAAVGGSLSIESTVGAGTTVHAVVPIAPATLAPARPEQGERFGTRVGRPPEPGLVVADRPRGRRSIPPVAAAMLAVGAAIGILAASAFLLDLPPRSPVDGRAEAFHRPFVFQTPAGAGIRLFEGPSDADPATRSAHLHVLTRSALAEDGISVWAVEDLLEDPCRIDGPTIARDPGVTGLLTALGRFERLDVGRVGVSSLDARPSTVIDLRVLDAHADCTSRALALWRDPEPTSGAWIQIPEAETVRVVLVDVDGATIAFEIWSRGSLADWLPTAEGIISSIRFLRTGSGAGS